ncbi:MAG: 50S ribosomal protein L24 [Steroidobacteraceae bacterium]|jgi:large subunit ribosomal protein L24
MEKIRKGDQVVVLSGRDKGRRGSVLRVLNGAGLLVENINKVKRHQKPNPQKNVPGGIIEKEMPLPVGKVAIWNPSAKKADRVGIKTLADGKKVRFFKSNGEMIDA